MLKSGTIAEAIDGLIDAIKTNNLQHGHVYVKSQACIIMIFDNNQDAKKDVISWEEYCREAKAINAPVRRKCDGSYDWWITILPVSDPIQAMQIELALMASD